MTRTNRSHIVFVLELGFLLGSFAWLYQRLHGELSRDIVTAITAVTVVVVGALLWKDRFDRRLE